MSEPDEDRLIEDEQDTALDSDTHLRGFYCYSAAIEPYAVVALTLFLPVALEQYAREAGSLASDHAVTCNDPTAICEVRILGVWTNTASFSLYTYSLSVAAQAITVIAISSEANDPAKRRRFLLRFTILGGISCALFVLVPAASRIWLLAPILTLVGNVCFGCAMVCLNTYVPTLAKERTRPYDSDAVDRDTDWEASESKAASAISAKGISIGYVAGVTLLLLLLIPVTLLKGSLWSLRLSLLSTGLWWLFLSIPAFRWLPRYYSSNNTTLRNINTSWTRPWTELLNILRDYKRLPETFKYLLAWFIMSDAFSTITSTAVLFAKTTLGMSATALVFIGVLTPVFGVLGALGWPSLQQNFLHTSNVATLRIVVALAILIPLYGLFALRTSWELLLLCCYFGALYGALQSYSRACFASLIPANEEARFFALYSITDKSSSFIGPAVVAVIADRTGSIRSGFIFLLAALLLPQPFLANVNMEKGSHDAEGYAASITTQGAMDEAP